MAILQQYEDILEVEVISSPPSTAQLSHDEEARVISSETSQEKPITPLTLGGSKFRRKQVVPTDISSPLVLHASDNLEIDANPLLEAQDSRPTTSTFDSIRSPPWFEHPEPLTSAATSRGLTARTSSGKTIIISKKPPWKAVLKAQEQRAASREQKEAYYGVDIHGLLDNIEGPTQQSSNKRSFPVNIKLTLDTMDTFPIHVKICGPINTVQLNLLIYLVTNASIAISCDG